jgi:hypothetical protein
MPLGDANHDGDFDSADLVLALQGGKYETQTPATWSEGDWNGDGLFESGDLVAAFATGRYEQAMATLPVRSVFVADEPLHLLRRLIRAHDWALAEWSLLPDRIL